MRQIFYVDVSELFTSGLQTGIQRVVRRIIRDGIEAAAETGVAFVPVIAIGTRFHRLQEAALLALLEPARKKGALLTEDSMLMRQAKSALSQAPYLYSWVQKRRLRRQIIARSVLWASEPVVLGPGDTVVLLDSFWSGSSALDAAAAARRTGCAVVVAVYDMIPITHPQFCDPRLAYAFPRALTTAMAVATGLITISQYCAGVIARFVAVKGSSLPVDYFYLGADLVKTFPGPTSLDVRSSADGARSHVMIGTIEPRKGHAAVLAAFDRLWSEGRADTLLIIGKIGWQMEEFISRCRSHAEFGKRLKLIHDADDATLAAAIANADAAIMASATEGFGLPLVEALYASLPVIASDIEVFREIAGDAALYFELDNAADLARAVAEMERDGSRYRAAANAFAWIDWREATLQFVRSVGAVTGAKADAAAKRVAAE